MLQEKSKDLKDLRKEITKEWKKIYKIVETKAIISGTRAWHAPCKQKSGNLDQHFFKYTKTSNFIIRQFLCRLKVYNCLTTSHHKITNCTVGSRNQVM